jgi:hypothetical protein
MNNLEIANYTRFEIRALKRKIKFAQIELGKLTRDKERKDYFLKLLEKEMTGNELESFQKLWREDDD